MFTDRRRVSAPCRTRTSRPRDLTPTPGRCSGWCTPPSTGSTTKWFRCPTLPLIHATSHPTASRSTVACLMPRSTMAVRLRRRTSPSPTTWRSAARVRSSSVSKILPTRRLFRSTFAQSMSSTPARSGSTSRIAGGHSSLRSWPSSSSTRRDSSRASSRPSWRRLAPCR